MAAAQKLPSEAPARGAIRVLMLGPALEVRGGISSVERSLIAALPPQVEVEHVATMREGSRGVKLGVFLRALGATWRRTAAQAKPDLVHIHFASRASSVRKMALARLALARGCRVVMHAHGGGYMDYWRSISRFQKRQILAVLQKASALIVLGETWRRFFAGIGVAEERIVVLPNPVALPRALPVRLGATPVTFVYLGLVSAAKGAFDLVEAVARIAPATRARLRVVVAGNGELAALRAAIGRAGLAQTIAVRPWLGAEERDALLACAEAFVLPSRQEGLPMALLEAMAWGLAPLATPVGAIPELVEPGTSGLLVPPGDVAALARAIEQLLDPAFRSQLGRAARRRVEPLAAERYAERLGRLYETLACNPSP
ncbi:MAG TPA: glycosyltransferase family 4 protein [Burkholderiales bacterium]